MRARYSLQNTKAGKPADPGLRKHHALAMSPLYPRRVLDVLETLLDTIPICLSQCCHNQVPSVPLDHMTLVCRPEHREGNCFSIQRRKN